MSDRKGPTGTNSPALVRRELPGLDEPEPGILGTGGRGSADCGSAGCGSARYEQWNDGALMAAVAMRDAEAYTQLYRRHCRSVMATTTMILGRGTACDDVVTAVFLGIWVYPDRFDPRRGSLLSFLRLMARCRSIELLRAESRRKLREQGGSHELRVPAPDVDASLLALEASVELRRAVAALPPAEREPIRLAFFDQMSYRSVALYLHESEGTVKSRIRTGLQRLRRSGGLELSPEAEWSRSERPGNRSFSRDTL